MDTLDLLLHKCRRRSRKESKESFKVGRRLVDDQELGELWCDKVD